VSETPERTSAQVGPPSPPIAVGLPKDSPAQRAGRQRRPTGAPPPLPHPIAASTAAWLILAVVSVAVAFLISEQTSWLRLDDRGNTWFLRLLADVRTPWLTDVANAINAVGTGWGATVIGLAVVVLTIIFRRWQHLFVFLGSVPGGLPPRPGRSR
jgi:hypothetical protein